MAKFPKEFSSAFDTYATVSVLGEGGAGRVFEVSNQDGEHFALKCLVPERVTEERRKRFKNEIAFCQRTAHLNIVRVLDAGVVDVAGVKCPFYVMPLYRTTLRDLINAGIQPNNVLPMFSQLLDGIEAAHLKKVWHRDLKPENVLYDGDEKRLLIADFGIARFDPLDQETVVKTKAGAKLANMRYSAPEQRAKGMPVDHRADIFALGLILNEMFTKDVIHGTGYRTIASVAPDLGYLDQVVDLMIQNDAAARASSVEAVKKELIARGTQFVALQEVEAKSKEVVRKYAPGEVEPVNLIGVDWDGATVLLKLNRAPETGWVQAFQHPKSGHSNVMGYGPEVYQFAGSSAKVGNVREHIAQAIVDQFKTFSGMATRQYQEELIRQAAQREASERASLQAQREEAERRQRLLSKLKF